MCLFVSECVFAHVHPFSFYYCEYVKNASAKTTTTQKKNSTREKIGTKKIFAMHLLLALSSMHSVHFIFVFWLTSYHRRTYRSSLDTMVVKFVDASQMWKFLRHIFQKKNWTCMTIRNVKNFVYQGWYNIKNDGYLGCRSELTSQMTKKTSYVTWWLLLRKKIRNNG